MTLFRLFASCVLSATMLTVSVKESVYAATPFEYFPIEILRGTTKLTVYIKGNYTEYANGEDCGNNAHLTRKSTSSGLAADRRFSHIHGTSDFASSPYIIGYVQDPTFAGGWRAEPFTIAEVAAYWDDYYGPYYAHLIFPQGGETPKTNCWGHTLGFPDIWIQDPSRIYANDYGAPLPKPEAGCISVHPGHVRKVTGTDEIPLGFGWFLTYITGTTEKNRSSGIYDREWFNGYQPASGSYHKEKP